VVFVVGMEEGLLPWGRAGGRDEEERRLFYVAITRARDRLFLIHARSRRDYQGRVTRAELAPSPFLRLLPRELTERVRLD
jgi:DNA helicase-2/ATP-dependent DNA helicase PcrA